MPSVTDPEPTPPTLRRVLGATAAATTCGVLPGFLIGSQAVQLSRDLALDLASVGAAVAVAWLTASTLSAAMGRVSERMGGGRGLRLAALTSAASMAWIAVVARSWPLLAVGAAMGGAGNALAQPAANVVIARTLPPERHGLGFGVKQAAIPMATVLGGLAVPLLTLTLGWRATFAVGAVLALGAALLVPRHAGAPVGAELGGVEAGRDAAADEGVVAGASPVADADAYADADAPADDAAPDDDDAAPASSLDGRTGSTGGVLGATPRRSRRGRHRSLIVLGIGVGCGAATAAALSSFLVAGAVDAGMGEGVAGLLLMGGSVIGIVVRLSLGVRADRVGRDQLPLVGGLMATGAVAVAAFAVVSVPAYVLATPVAFGAGWAWPGLFNLSVVRRFPDSPGAATGATQTGTYLGAGIGPLAFGVLVDATGFATAWLVGAAVLAAGSVAMAVGGRRTRPVVEVAPRRA